MPHPITTEYRCSAARFAACTGPTAGRPKRQKCPACGAPFASSVGTYAVIAWRGDGRYRVENAVATYKSPDRAQRRANEEGNLVVRFLPVAREQEETERMAHEHEHEAWQIRESPDGSHYCAACGRKVD